MAVPRDWRLFFASQVTSKLGSSFTGFGLPLLAFTMTGSAMGLAITTVTEVVPYLLFGLVIGAWGDRIDRRRAAIAAGLLRGLIIALIPVLWLCGSLNIWLLYTLAFANTSVGIVSLTVEGTALPSLVDADRLIEANSKLQAASSVAYVVGPLLAGALVGGGMSIPWVFGFDAISFVLAAVALSLIRTKFNLSRDESGGSVFAAVGVGLRYVMAHRVLRGIAVLAALYNLVSITVLAQLVDFAHLRLHADSVRIGILFAAGALGTAVVTVTVGRFKRHMSFRVMTLGSLAAWGFIVLLMSFTTSFWVGAVLWSAAAGMPIVFSIRTMAYRQETVPNHLLGRAQIFAAVLAWSTQPIGVIAGAWAIEATGRISVVYGGIAVAVLLLAFVFRLGSLGRPDHALPRQGQSADTIGVR